MNKAIADNSAEIAKNATVTYDLLNQDELDSKLVVKNVNISNDKVVIKGSEEQIKKLKIEKQTRG